MMIEHSSHTGSILPRGVFIRLVVRCHVLTGEVMRWALIVLRILWSTPQAFSRCLRCSLFCHILSHGNSPAVLILVYNPDKKRARGFPLAHVKCLFSSLVMPSKTTPITTEFYCVSDTYIESILGCR